MANAEAQIFGNREDISFPYKIMPDVMPGTRPLPWQGDLSVRMLDGAHQFMDDEINQSVLNRSRLWNRDLSSPAAYEKSIEPNRNRFMQYIGVEDKSKSLSTYSIGLSDKQPVVYMQKISLNNDPELVAETTKYFVYQVRWPVLNRVYGEGILLQPKIKPVANIVAIPDADQTPEQLAGLSHGIPPESQFARHLAENGFQVLIPVLISRTLLFQDQYQQQTYREWIYRQAFHMGRHVIGYEVQKVLSAIDWFKQSADKDVKIGVAGYNEGGLIAFYAAASDNRIDATLVSGYFDSRQKVWDEPIYRNVWGLLSEFGDAEIASLIAPRALVIEHSVITEVIEDIEKSEEKRMQVGGLPYSGYKGKLQTSSFGSVKNEYDRIDALIRPGFQPKHLISGPKNTPVSFGSASSLEKFALSLGYKSSLVISKDTSIDQRSTFDPEARQIRQAKEMEDHVQWLLRDSDQERNRFFLYKVMPEFAQRTWSPKSYHPYYSPGHFMEEGKAYRKYFHEEILGKFDNKMLPPNPQTRKLYDKERWTGYEVGLDVYPNLFAAGILLIPKDLKPGEKRPVVVCQHGRNSTPHELVEGNFNYYNDAAAKLADQGFIVYAPQNPYRGEDRYRWLDRKANSLKKTLFSFIISQHDQTLQWLATLPFVDKNRIAFYGLSYGGETAMRVPSVLEGYCLSICSGDFGDWTRKVVDTHNKVSFMNTLEWEMPYFNMGSTFSYAEMAYLIFPRPFMVERGHDDLVQPDEWVAYEYGKVKYVYDKFNLEDKTTIEYFNGGHSMRNEGSFKFLHKHLRWP
ncbi:MAG: dienelactone hydrolase family protein [Bacteroidia bacterium]|nr:dienelactone hydrolase family protein [Bacteroidia bacterium]